MRTPNSSSSAVSRAALRRAFAIGTTISLIVTGIAVAATGVELARQTAAVKLN